MAEDSDIEPEAGSPEAAADEVDEWGGWDADGEPEDLPAVVRPYARTSGRTRPVQDLGVETLVVTSERGRDHAEVGSVEHLTIAGLCEQPRSVAEVAALLPAPLGVARVLLADMVGSGLVEVLPNPGEPGDAPDLPLLQRVLAGLRNL
ncbi:MAG: DUF742 domain-containing protein [Pseudonocardiaceae bacterium]